MAHCINLNHPDIIKFAQEFDLTKEDVGAVIAVWQEDSDEYDRFPSMEEFKSQLTEDITATINLGNRINALRKLNSLQTVPEQQVDIPINEELMQLISPVLEELNSKGNSPLVIGGAVRDALLGKSPKDIDIEIYNTSIEDLNSTLSKYGKVDEVGKSFGILKFTPYKQDTTELVDIEEPFDFSVPRRENKTGTGYQGFSTEFDTSITIEEASSRRDFTWNSIGYNPVNKTLYDYYGGIADLRNGVIRHTTDKFAEDPLRILRAMQFQSRMNHKLAPETAELIKEMVEKGMLDELSKQRIVMEWMKWAVKGSNPQLIFDFLRETGMGNKYFPELMKLRETPQDAEYHPEGDVEVHTRQVLEKAQEIAVREKLDEEEKAVLIFSALFHDVAKPPTTAEMYVEKKGRNVITSRGHEAMGAEMLPDILDRMGITKAISSKVIPLVREHLAHATISGIESEKGQLSAFIKLNDRLEAASIDSLVRLMEADMLGRDNKNAPVPETINTFNSLKERYNAISGGGKKITPLITGKDLISLGFESGPVLGNIVRTALNAQKNLEFTDRDGALSWLNNYLKNEGYEVATEEQLTSDINPETTNIASTIYELIPNITEDKIDEIYNNYVSLMSKARKGKEISKESFKNLLKSYQVFNYKDTYIFGNYDIENGVFITRVNSSPSSKELLAEALPTLVQQGIDFASFVPEDVANKYKRSGYSVSTQGFDYNFKGEDMVKYLAVSNPNVPLKIFNKSLNELSDTEIENYNNSFELKYNPVEIKGDLIEKAGKDVSKIFETYLSQFGIKVKDINEIKDKLGIDELGFADILSKIAYVKDKKDLPPIAGEFIAYMMQYNPLVSDIIKELSQTKDYKNLDKSEYFKIIGGLISDDLQNKLEGNYSKSLLQKLKELIKEFFSLLNNTPVDLINKNIGIISNNILQQNKKLVTASLYKPGAFGKPTKQVSLQEAMESDKFGASIIDNLSKKGFILTGSTSLGEQGTIQRPNENLLHDIDWISPFSRQETEKLFKETYPEAIKIRDIYGEGYITDTWIIAPNGYKIKDLVKESDYNIITSYDVINNKGEIVGTYRLIKQQNSNQKEEVVTGIEAKVIDFFSYEKYEQLTPFEKNGIKLANWKEIFKAKLQFARYKDIWDYNRFIPNENTSQITPQQPTTSIKKGVEELFNNNPELANQVYEALGFKQTVIQDDKSYYRGQIEKPTIDKDGNLVLYGREDELYKRAGLKSYGVSMTDDLQIAIDYGQGQFDGAQLRFNDLWGYDINTWEAEDAYDEMMDNGYWLIQIPKDIPNEIVNNGEEVKVIGNKIIVPKGQYKIEQVAENVEQITSQQKQQALQLYSQYLDTIFPDSKVKDIVYHGTDVKREVLSSLANRLKTRLTVSQEGSDGFGYVLGLFNNNQERIGKIVFRSKTYLKDKGYPVVNELHLGFEENYQSKGYFQDALIELLKYDSAPIFISSGRVINNNVFKAINKLDKNKLNVTKIEDGYIIELPVEYVYDKTGGEEGIYFTNLKERGEYYSDWRSGFNISGEVLGTDIKPNYIVYSALLDIKNPSAGTEIKNKAAISSNDRDKIKGDGLIYNVFIQNNKQEIEYVVFEPEQIHILGSQKDIQGFKEFSSTQQQPAIDPTTVYQQLGITFTNDENKPCAANGLTDAVTGTNWKIVKDFAGKPKHSEGGVDITISNDGVYMRKGGKDIKAANGLLIANSIQTKTNNE